MFLLNNPKETGTRSSRKCQDYGELFIHQLPVLLRLIIHLLASVLRRTERADMSPPIGGTKLKCIQRSQQSTFSWRYLCSSSYTLKHSCICLLTSHHERLSFEPASADRLATIDSATCSFTLGNQTPSMPLHRRCTQIVLCPVKLSVEQQPYARVSS
jgi:hypothetical protein